MYGLALPNNKESTTKNIIKSAKEFYTCNCGLIVNKYNRAQHSKTIKHKKLINELMAQKRQDNFNKLDKYFTLSF
jgi:hypothetical protein